MHLFCVLHNQTISLCMHLSDIEKRVTSLPVYKSGVSYDPCYLLLFFQLKSNIKCKSCLCEPVIQMERDLLITNTI